MGPGGRRAHGENVEQQSTYGVGWVNDWAAQREADLACGHRHHGSGWYRIR